MTNEHIYTLDLQWTGKKEIDHHRNDRIYEIELDGKDKIKGSADKPFFGDPSLYNPEDLLLSSLSACHMMSFLYVCRQEKLKVLSYQDQPIAYLKLHVDGSGCFTKAILKPKVKFVKALSLEKINTLHKKAGSLCFIANSCNFQIEYEPIILE